MPQTLTSLDRYASDFQRLRQSGPDWLRTLRSEAFERFQHLGFPTARQGNEVWKYTDIRPIANEVFEYSQPQPTRRTSFRLTDILPFDSGLIRIAVIDGRFSPEHSTGLDSSGLRAMSLASAIDENSDLLQQHLGQHANWHDDAFIALSTAFIHDGLFIHATEPLQTPVHLVYASTATHPAVTHPRTLIVGAPLSQQTLIESYVSPSAQRHFTNAVTEIALGDGAILDHYRLLLENDQAYHIGYTRATLGRDSSFRSLAYAAGGDLTRNDVRVLLDATGCETDLRGLYITSNTQHVDNNVNIDHAQPHTTSRLYYKGILDDESKAVFGGTVFVRPGADKTDAHQQDKNLLLSHEAEVASKPALEIYADDVKAGHGATAGTLADEALFYMQSRGIDEFTAQQLLVRGFASEILDTITIEALREWLEARTTVILPRFQVEETTEETPE